MRSALVIDLDGTLLHTNTFRDYLNMCGRCSVHAFRWDLALSIVFWVGLRKLRIISHALMKRHLMQHTALFMQRKGRMDDFVEEELLLLNHEVKAEVELYRNRGYLLILATAAPAFYARAIADNLRLDVCLATPLPSEVVIGEWHENVGLEKLHALMQSLHLHGACLDAVITDHHDDLPLLRQNAQRTNLLVSPTKETISLISKENISFSTL